jgi:beta-lactamase class D
MMKIYKLSLVLLVLLNYSCTQKSQSTEKTTDFKKYFDKYDVTGSFVLFDPQENVYYHYNKEQYTKAYTPASTFKICNSLIGLETGVIKDADFVISWDGVNRERVEWNQDQTLRMAMQNSTVWYYQELARRVGQKQMDYWIKEANYGNHSTKGGIDKFWLEGGLRISPKQQIDFLIKLHDNKLPFSQRNMDIVKEIMIVKDTLNTIVHAKAGWGQNGKEDIGWFVGYVEKGNKVYYFANCLQTTDFDNKHFGPARKEIVYDILDELNILKR